MYEMTTDDTSVFLSKYVMWQNLKRISFRKRFNKIEFKLFENLVSEITNFLGCTVCQYDFVTTIVQYDSVTTVVQYDFVTIKNLKN